MEYHIFVGRRGVSSHSNMYYHSVSVACHSEGPKREEGVQTIKCQNHSIAGTKGIEILVLCKCSAKSWHSESGGVCGEPLVTA